MKRVFSGFTPIHCGALLLLLGLAILSHPPAVSQTTLPVGPPLTLPYSARVSSADCAFFIANDGAGQALCGSSGGGVGVYGLNLNGNFGEIGGPVLGVYGVSSVENGEGVFGRADNGTIAIGVHGQSVSGYGMYGYSGTGIAVYGTSDSNTGVLGLRSDNGNFGQLGMNVAGVYGSSANGNGVQGSGANGFYGESPVYNGNGVYGIANVGPSAYGVWGQSSSGYGVVGYGANGGVVGASAGGDGVRGIGGTNAYGVHGISSNVGVRGENSSTGVYGYLGGGLDGVYGYSPAYEGVQGSSDSGDGVYGLSNSGFGVRGVVGAGTSTSAAGVWGNSLAVNGNGVIGVALSGSSAYAIWGRGASGYGGFFEGKVWVSGRFDCSDKHFKIDHPLDPANKYLFHSCVESDERMNLYRGKVVTDAQGYASVSVPDWFTALNDDIQYQLTVADAGDDFMQAKITRELEDGRFVLRTSGPNVKVFWLLTGVRKDAYARAHPTPVEEEKPEGERGTYLHPAENGQPETLGVNYERIRSLENRAQKRTREDAPARPKAFTFVLKPAP